MVRIVRFQHSLTQMPDHVAHLFQPQRALSLPQLGLACLASGTSIFMPPWLRCCFAVLSIGLAVSGLSLTTRMISLAASASNAQRQRSIKRRVAERERRVQQWSQSQPTPPELATITPPRFDVDDPRMLQHLRDQGFAVVRSVADASELAHAEALLWEFLEGRTDMLRGEPSTWTNSNFESVGDRTNGILSGNGFGHAEVCWFTRTLPKVRATFARIWGTTPRALMCAG